MQIGTTIMENSMDILQKTKYRTTIWSSNLTPGHISWQNYNSKRYRHPYVHCNIFTIAKTWKPCKYPLTEEWIQKVWYFPQKRKSWDWRIDLWLPGGEGEGGGGIGSLGLKDLNYCFWNGLTMRSYCVALRTMSRYSQRSMAMGEKVMCRCMCNWVPML